MCEADWKSPPQAAESPSDICCTPGCPLMFLARPHVGPISWFCPRWPPPLLLVLAWSSWGSSRSHSDIWWRRKLSFIWGRMSAKKSCELSNIIFGNFFSLVSYILGNLFFTIYMETINCKFNETSELEGGLQMISINRSSFRQWIAQHSFFIY